METTEKLLSNIWKMYVLRIVRGSLVVMPIIVLFYTDNGLTLSQVFLLQSIFAASVVFFELPTWYLWDMMTRKWSMLIWMWISLFAWAAYALLPWWFWQFALVEMFLALWFTFVSGSDTALIYDSLLAAGIEDEFKKIKGKYLSCANFAEAWWSLIWWFLVTYGYQIPFLFQSFLFIIWVRATYQLVEPPRVKFEADELGFENLKNTITYFFNGNRSIRNILLYSTFVSISWFLLIRFIQPIWKDLWIPVYLFWLLWCLGNLLVAVFSRNAYRIEKILWSVNLIHSFFPAFIIMYFLLWWVYSLWVLPVIIIVYAVRGVQTIVFADILNRQVASSQRAIVFSVKSLLFRFLFIPLWPFIWWIGDLWSIETAMFACWFLVCLFLLVSLFLMKNEWWVASMLHKR